MFRTVVRTCRVSCRNKFVKLLHLVGFIIKKFITMYGHTNVKYRERFAVSLFHELMFHCAFLFMKYCHKLRGKQVTGEIQGLTGLRATLNRQKVNGLVYV
jgi:hypothetical protein